jgi:hypothetical protein
MSPIFIPAGIPIKSARFGLQFNTQQHISPLSRTTQRIELPGARWMANYTLAPTKRSELAAIQAFLIQLRGGANTFWGYDPAATSPRGTATGTPLVNGGSQVGTSLVTDGWTPNVTGILKAGDYFQVGSELKMLVGDVNSNGSGQATLLFEPPLRESPADNAAITVASASCVMRLVDDDQIGWDEDEALFYGISFSAVESFF